MTLSNNLKKAIQANFDAITAEEISKLIKSDGIERFGSRADFDLANKSINPSSRNKKNRKARDLNISPFEYYLLNNIRKSFNQVEEWTVGLSRNRRSRIRKEANLLNMTPSEYLKLKGASSCDNDNSVKSSNRQLVKREMRELANQINENSLNNLPLTKEVEVITWDSLTMKELIETDASYKQAKGIVYQLINGSEEIRQKTFIEKGSLMAESDIKKRVLSLITDERMLPIEEKFMSKVGNFKTKPFKDWYGNVLKLWQKVDFNPDVSTLNKAVDKIKQQLSELIVELQSAEGNPMPEGLVPLSLEEAYEKVTKSRHSGYPFYTNKWSQNDEMVSY